jgi:hypothetical protein
MLNHAAFLDLRSGVQRVMSLSFELGLVAGP